MKQNTKENWKIAGWVVGGLIAISAVGWLGTTQLLFKKAVFDPKFEEVRRNTFETSKAYRDGMAQELRSLQIQYIKADPALQPALAGVILHKAAGVPSDAIPPDLQTFLYTLNVQATQTK